MARRRTPISHRIGQGIMGALEAYGAAREWKSQQQQSEALERWRNAQAADLESQAQARQFYFDLLGSPDAASGTGVPGERGNLRSPVQARRTLETMPMPGVGGGYAPVERPPTGLLDRSDDQTRFAPEWYKPVEEDVPATGKLMAPLSLLEGRPTPGTTPTERPLRPLSPGATGGAPLGLVDRPLFRSGVTAFETTPEPVRFRKKDLRLHNLAQGFGQTHYPPLEETQEWKNWSKTEEEMLSEAIKMLFSPPTLVEHTDRNLRPVKTYVNMPLQTSSGLVEWLKANHPRLAMHLPEDMRTKDPTRPAEGMSAADKNNRFIQDNSSPQEIVNSMYSSQVDQDNPVLRRMNEQPAVGMTRTWGGGVSFLNLSSDDRRFLIQMVPLSNVTMLIADYSSRLNKEDYAFMAALTAAGQTIDSWFGLEFFLDPNEPGIDEEERQYRAWDRQRAAAAASQITDDQRTNLKKLQGLASDDLIHLARLRNAFAGLFAELGGERGRKTEDDVKRAKQMLTGLGDTAGTTRRSMDLIFRNFIEQYDGLIHGTRETLDEKMAQMERARACWGREGFFNYKSLTCEVGGAAQGSPPLGVLEATPLVLDSGAAPPSTDQSRSLFRGIQ